MLEQTVQSREIVEVGNVGFTGTVTHRARAPRTALADESRGQEDAGESPLVARYEQGHQIARADAHIV